ncbi:MAG TPA: trehalose-phosphatase [Vicinamibacterales bacterium]|nr:trehalose-phosphatase [Vicinamibacterales bacterium]
MDAAPSRVAAEIQRRRAARHLLLLFDFDGTLCGFQADPAAVRLPDVTRRLLDRLAHAPATTVAIVSGRRLQDVADRARLPAGVFYAGFHGLEARGGDETYVHPAAAAAVPVLRRIRQDVEARLRALPGVFIEDKGFSIALHDREAEDVARATAREAFLRAASDAIGDGRLRVLPGACVLELMPNVAWNKGSAVRWIRERVERRHGASLPVYVGDDVTDEDAFRAVAADGVSIAVSDRASGAQFRLDGPADVEALLRALVEEGGW